MGEQPSPETLTAELERLRPLAEMGRMAATVAHEIRNPLAGIRANTELLREAADSADDIETLDIIITEVDRLGNLVGDLLCYCRERPSEAKPIDLAHLVRTTIDLQRSEAERAGVSLGWSGSGMAVGDGDLSRQALLNVIRNAIQATPRGGSVRVVVDTSTVAVSDTGRGVPESIRATLFEPFVTGRTRGLGLGATVARRCLERQGGSLVLGATGPHGSTFRFTWG